MNLPLLLGVRNSFPALAATLAAATVLSAQAQPELVSVVPDRFAIAVSPGAQVILIFSVPMNTNATAAQFTNFSSAGPVFLPATQEWADGDTVLICTPDPIWPRKQVVAWSVRGEDLTGTPLEPATGVFFTSSGGSTNPTKPGRLPPC